VVDLDGVGSPGSKHGVELLLAGIVLKSRQPLSGQVVGAKRYSDLKMLLSGRVQLCAR
jgi:hypothetical protein